MAAVFPGGAGGGPSLIAFGLSSVGPITQGSNVFPPVNGAVAHNDVTATGNLKYPFLACTLKNLRITVAASPGVGQNIFVVVQVNEVDTLLTATIVDDGLAASNLTNTVAVTAGSRVRIRVLNSAGSAAENMAGTIEVA